GDRHRLPQRRPRSQRDVVLGTDGAQEDRPLHGGHGEGTDRAAGSRESGEVSERLDQSAEGVQLAAGYCETVAATRQSPRVDRYGAPDEAPISASLARSICSMKNAWNRAARSRPSAGTCSYTSPDE